MPMRYELRRDNYTLYAAHDQLIRSPAVIISIESDTIPGISVVGTSIRCAALVERPLEVEVRKYGYPENGFRFRWGPTRFGSCSNAVLPTGDDRQIEVTVLDGDGKLIAVENLLFDIEKNGTYREGHF